MKNGNCLFESYAKDRTLFIKLIADLSCKNWGAYWGEVDRLIEEDVEARYSDIVIIFEKCFSADAMALGSVILDLIHIKEDIGRKVRVILPHLDGQGSDITTERKAESINFRKGQFLKYLSSQGFMSVMRHYFEVKHLFSNISDEMEAKYKNYKYSLPYCGELLYPFSVFSCNNELIKDKIVREVIDTTMLQLGNSFSLQIQNSISEQLFNIVNELVENVFRHAYKDEENKRCFVYIRRRQGLPSAKGNADRQKDIENEILLEKRGWLKTDTKVYLDNYNFLEVFFADTGMGLTQSLQAFFAGKKKDYTYPVRELFRKVLFDGLRKDPDSALTPYGGLHYICRIMGDNRGYIICNEGKEWAEASAIELIGKKGNVEVGALSENRHNAYPKGLNWCFRIPFNVYDASSRIGSVWEGKYNVNPILLAYRETSHTKAEDNIICIDEMRERLYFAEGGYSDWKVYPLDKKLTLPKIKKEVTCLWFPKGTYSKNQISTRIGDLLNILASSISLNEISINWIIADVDSNSMFSFLYSLDGISLQRLKLGAIRQVSIISKKWEVIILSKRGESLSRDKEAEKKVFRIEDGEKTIPKSMLQYALFLRDYDSFLFWSFVKNFRREKIYINANVEWGAKQIKGYLDIERAYLNDEIYRIVINSLSRLSGVSIGFEAKYSNIDSTAARVCREINTNSLSELKDEMTIYVCGACVTGYSIRSFFPDRGPSINVIMFVHPAFDQELSNVARLFLWPNAQFFDSFENEEQTYYRLGKTSLITRKKGELLIDSEPIGDATVRNEKEKYDDFQKESPKLIRYGHYATDNHHYLIGFDFLPCMKQDFLKKEGLFLYFLWKIAYYLGGEDLSNVYKGLRDLEWVEPLKRCRYKKDSIHGELVLYHSNICTEYVLKRVKEILSPDMSERILPVNMYEIQAKGSPITFSPFVMDYVEEYYASKDKRGIMFVDSTFSTGRKMLEVENILMAAGVKKVSFLSIVDMRRLRKRDTKTVSYWRVNVPRLDDNGHCVICDTLKALEEFKTKVYLEYSSRLSEWQRDWGIVGVNNPMSDHGIEAIERLSCSFNKGTEREINIRDSVSLNLYISELLCESYNNDLVYRYINEKTDLPIEIRMQLICSQIILFGNMNSRQLQLNMLCELIGLLSRSQNCNSYTSLVGLVLLSQKKSVIRELLKGILVSETSPKIKRIKDDMLKSDNKDLILAIGYFMKNDVLIESLFNGNDSLDVKDTVFTNALNNMIIPNKELRGLFKDFEGLYVNEGGRKHNTNRQKLTAEHATDIEDFKTKCQLVINDMDRLFFLAGSFPISLVSSRGSGQRNQLNPKELLAELRKGLLADVTRYESLIAKGERSERYVISDASIKAIKKCEEYFDEILKDYYILFENDVEKYFDKLIGQKGKEYNKVIEYEITHDPEIEGMHKYYYWNQSIEKEFIYLLENVDHCDLRIKEEDEKSSHMIIQIHFGYNEIMITLKSWSETLAEQVDDEFRRKNRLSKEQAVGFEVLFDFISTEKTKDSLYHLLVVRMSIPACFKRLEGETKNG